MLTTINAKTFRHELARIVERVRKGEGFTVLYRSRPAFRIVPVEGPLALGSWEDDSLYLADAVGRSSDGLTALDHDRMLYSSREVEG